MELREELQKTMGSTYTLEREFRRGGMARVFVAAEPRLRQSVVVKVLSVGILGDVARALSYAHAHGVVHRDIKPDNVLLSHGAAVVTDFGSAKAIAISQTTVVDPTLTQPGAPIGTPAHMAPEQVAAELDIDHRADVYAFGCLAYELLIGHPPFTDPSAQQVLVAYLKETPKPISELRPETPSSLAALVMRCLEKHRNERPTSADEVSEALDTVAAPRVTDAPGPFARAARRARWRPIAALLAAVSIVVAGVVLWRGRGAPTAGVAEKSVTVLPLANLSDNQFNDYYFGTGLAEELADMLNKVRLRVTSAGQLVKSGLDAREIGKRLSVGYVLGRSVQEAGGSVRITMHLTSVRDGTTMWSSTYTEPFKNVFAVQDSIVHRVASALQVTLAGGSRAVRVQNETARTDRVREVKRSTRCPVLLAPCLSLVSRPS